jgi:hypothetical protein
MSVVNKNNNTSQSLNFCIPLKSFIKNTSMTNVSDGDGILDDGINNNFIEMYSVNRIKK